MLPNNAVRYVESKAGPSCFPFGGEKRVQQMSQMPGRLNRIVFRGLFQRILDKAARGLDDVIDIDFAIKKNVTLPLKMFQVFHDALDAQGCLVHFIEHCRHFTAHLRIWKAPDHKISACLIMRQQNRHDICYRTRQRRQIQKNESCGVVDFMCHAGHENPKCRHLVGLHEVIMHDAATEQNHIITAQFFKGMNRQGLFVCKNGMGDI